MATTYEYQSAFAREYVEQGRQQGREQGRVEGRAEGEARMLLTMLDAFGIAVTDDERDRVLACNDLEQLHRWAGRVKSITSADELFA